MNKGGIDDPEAVFSVIARRDPSKRQIKPVSSENFSFYDELDDDSDSEYVCGSDGTEVTGSDDGSSVKSASSSKISEETDGELDEPTVSPAAPKVEVEQTDLNGFETTLTNPNFGISTDVYKKHLNLLVCIICLGDSDGTNGELIECDECGIVVHEDCYKLADSIFLSSGASSSSTDAWFCEPCLASVSSPLCDLCPNTGGAFKRTDNNRWVHLICALYTPGIAFNDPENLMDVTLTELPAKMWSMHECSLCDDSFFAWTGVCISCDAGMCRTFFHVTCAQRNGLLSEPTYDENTVDPFFAQCRQHTDKTVARQRRRNYLTALSRIKQKQSEKAVAAKPISDFDQHSKSALDHMGIFKSQPGSECNPRLQRKLSGFQSLYQELRSCREKPYVLSSKTPLFLETSPVAMRLFVMKAKTLHLPVELSGQSSTSDSAKAPASGCPIFAPEFISYFFDREKKITEVSTRICSLQNARRELQITEASASHSFNSVSAQLDALVSKRGEMRSTGNRLVELIRKILPDVSCSAQLSEFLTEPRRPPDTKAEEPGLVIRRAMGAGERSALSRSRLGFSRGSTSTLRKGVYRSRGPRSTKSINSSQNTLSHNGSKNDMNCSSGSPENVILSCFVCHGLQDQHLITKCDTCGKAFHLSCLDPPMVRMPKRSRLFGWQCCHCTKAVASHSDPINVDVNEPRQLRRSLGKSVCPPNLDASGVSEVPNMDAKTNLEEITVSPVNITGTLKVDETKSTTEVVPCSLTVNETTNQNIISYTPNLFTSHTVDNTPSISNPQSSDSDNTLSRKRTKARNSFNITPCIPKRSRRLTSRLTALMPVSPETGEHLNKKQSKMPTQVSSRVARLDACNPSQRHISKGLEAYDYDEGPNSDEEIARLRNSKVVKFVKIRDHASNDESEPVEQIAPLHMRYMICPDSASSRRSNTSKFRMKFKKL